MVNGVYTVAKQGLIDGTIDMDTDTIQVVLLDNTATFTLTDTTMTQVTSTASDRLDTDVVLGNKTVTDGVFDNTVDSTWTAVSGNDIGACVVYKFITNDAGSTPIVFVELADTSTNGGDITVNWDNGGNKIFALTG